MVDFQNRGKWRRFPVTRSSGAALVGTFESEIVVRVQGNVNPAERSDLHCTVLDEFKGFRGI